METNLTSQQLINFLGLLKQKKLTPARFDAVMESGILADVFNQDTNLGDRDSVRAALKLWAGMPGDMRFVTVGGSMTFKQRIREDGGLVADRDFSSINLSKRYDLMKKEAFGGTLVQYTYNGYPETRQLLEKLFCFHKEVAPQDVVLAMQQDRFEPATLEELMAFGTTFPELQEEFQIYALGSILYWGSERIPALWLGRCLRLSYLTKFVDTGRGHRYLGVQSSTSIG